MAQRDQSSSDQKKPSRDQFSTSNFRGIFESCIYVLQARYVDQIANENLLDYHKRLLTCDQHGLGRHI